MRHFSLRRYFLLLVIAAAVSAACNKPEGKDQSKIDPTPGVVVDTPKHPSPSDPGVSTQSPSPTGITLVPNDVTDPNKDIPIGSMPLLRPEQLTQFHPRLPDFILDKAKVIDEKLEAQSIILFRFKDDTSRTLKSVVIDANEKASAKLIGEMTQMQKNGKETRMVDGEPVTSYYTVINGMPAIRAYIPAKTLATLYILVGDHRAVVLREYKTSSTDHLLKAAQTIDFKTFEKLNRN